MDVEQVQKAIAPHQCVWCKTTFPKSYLLYLRQPVKHWPMSRQLPQSYKAQLLRNAFLCSAHPEPDWTRQVTKAPKAGGWRRLDSCWDRAGRAPCSLLCAVRAAGPPCGMNGMGLCVRSVKDNGPLSSSLHVSSMSAWRDFLHSILKNYVKGNWCV